MESITQNVSGKDKSPNNTTKIKYNYIKKKSIVFKTKISDKIALFYQSYNTDSNFAEYYGFEDIEANNKDKIYIYKIP